ncbi:MAG: hypothetical protein C4291_06665 [Candidatus Dadabacteria bacterium]
MKLLLISSHFPNIFGGVSDYSYLLSKTLSKEGLEVYVLTSYDDRVINDTEDNLRVLTVVKRWSLMGIPKIIKEVKRINPDWVLLQYVPYMYSYYGVPAYIVLLSFVLRIMRFKFITTFHEIGMELDLKKPKYWGIAVLQRLIAYAMCIASDKVVISSEPYRKTIEIFDKKVTKIPIGSNILPVYISDRDKRELRRQISSDQEIIISTFGANPRRNYLLLRVIKKLREEKLPVKFLVIGGFPKDWIEAIKIEVKELELDDAICFTGFLKSEDVYRYLSISDLFVILEGINSKGRGGISIKNTSLTAAFAAGLPIIGNRGHMTSDFLNNRENIILIDSLDEETICEEIKKLLADPTLIENLKIGAVRTFETKLSWPIIAKRYIELFSCEEQMEYK